MRGRTYVSVGEGAVLGQQVLLGFRLLERGHGVNAAEQWGLDTTRDPRTLRHHGNRRVRDAKGPVEVQGAGGAQQVGGAKHVGGAKQVGGAPVVGRGVDVHREAHSVGVQVVTAIRRGRRVDEEGEALQP